MYSIFIIVNGWWKIENHFAFSDTGQLEWGPVSLFPVKFLQQYGKYYPSDMVWIWKLHISFNSHKVIVISRIAIETGNQALVLSNYCLISLWNCNRNHKKISFCTNMLIIHMVWNAIKILTEILAISGCQYQEQSPHQSTRRQIPSGKFINISDTGNKNSLWLLKSTHLQGYDSRWSSMIIVGTIKTFPHIISRSTWISMPVTSYSIGWLSTRNCINYYVQHEYSHKFQIKYAKTRDKTNSENAHIKIYIPSSWRVWMWEFNYRINFNCIEKGWQGLTSGLKDWKRMFSSCQGWWAKHLSCVQVTWSKIWPVFSI